MKKYISALISVALFLTTITVITSAETETINFQAENIETTAELSPEITQPLATSGQCGDNAFWEFDGETLYITGEGDMWDYERVVNDGYGRFDENYSYFTSPWFFLSPKYLRINDGITSIGQGAFADVQLIAAFIPDSVTNIEADSFWDTSTSLIDKPGYPPNVRVAVVCSEGSVAEIYAKGYAMTCITEEVQVEGVTFLSKDGKKFLYYNYWMNPYDYFRLLSYYCIVPDGVEKIAENAFEGSNLSYIELPETVKTIAPTAFADCDSLRYLYNPLNNNSEICEKEVKNEKLVIQDEVLFTQDFSVLVRYSPTKPNEKYIIPDTVKTIEEWAFHNNIDIKSITIPDSVTTIGKAAFSSCNSLERITFGKGLKEIQNRAFEECRNLDVVEIPYGVETINYYAFGGCDNLSIAIIPETVKEIGKSNFLGNTKIVYGDNSYAKEYAETNGIMYIERVTEVDGVYFNEDMTVLVAYPINRPAKEYTIPDIVLTIGVKSFYRATLENVTIPQSVTTIDENAFTYCENLVSIEIPDSVTTMNSGAFQHCDALKSIKLSKGLETLSSNVFSGCNVEDITIAENIKTIEDSAFNWCPSLKSVKILGNVQSIEKYAFSYCHKLETVRIGENVESIADNAFEYSRGLKSITIPANVTSIGEDAFYEVDTLTIYGYEGGYVADYVENYIGTNTINFVSIGENPPTEIVKLVTMNKTLLGKMQLTPETEYLYDIYQDGKIDVLDLAVAKRELLSSVN